MKNFVLWYFEFYDHSSEDSWKRIEHETDAEPERIALVGWVIRETKHHLCVAQGLHLDGNRHGAASTARFYLLKACIIKKRRLSAG